jgi:lysophospholipase L1-like esterase
MKGIVYSFLAAAMAAGTVWAQQLSTTPVSRMGEGWWKDRFAVNSANAKKGPYDIIFLGDSITDFWRDRGRTEYEKYFDSYKVINMGYSADRTEHVLWRIDNGELDGANAKVIILMIGTNNTGHRPNVEKPQDTADGIKAILDRLAKHAPDSKVLLLGIFPRSATHDDRLRVQNDQVNTLIQKFADNKRVFWMDIGNKFLQPDGTLSKDIFPDLLHPNHKGYTIWAEAVMPFIHEHVDGVKAKN